MSAGVAPTAGSEHAGPVDLERTNGLLLVVPDRPPAAGRG